MAILALLLLLVCAGLVWGISAGIRTLHNNSVQGRGSATSQETSQSGGKKADTRKKVKNPEKTGKATQSAQKGARKCGPSDVELELNAPDPTTGVGGSIDFTATIRYKGTSSCLIDASNNSRVLVVKSGDQEIWRSDSCPLDARPLLMAKGDKDVQTMTWKADATQDQCQPEENLPRVEAGSYTAQLVLKSDQKVTSQAVPVMVQ